MEGTSRAPAFFPSLPGEMARALRGAAKGASRLQHDHHVDGLSPFGPLLHVYLPPPCTLSFTLDHLPDRLLGRAVSISPQWEE